jgi:D-alanine-D-alanine ligase
MDRDGRWFAGEALRNIDAYRAGTVEADPVVLDVGAGILRLEPAPAAPERRGLLRRGGGGESGPQDTEQRLDVVIPATHGTQGEDGCLQGALELADIPYAGPTLEAAVLAMNKAVTKSMLRAAAVPVLDDLTLRRSEYEKEGVEAIVAKVKARFGLPVYAKPASLGSSVGVSRCADDGQLADALQLAFELDRVALIEPAVEGGKEINCAVLGRPGAELRTSACEQPIASADFLSFEDKYMRESGGKGEGALKTEGMSSADRIIPAPISEEMTAQVQHLAKRTFEVLGCTGVARVDLLLDAQDRLFVNEPNTIPGSFAFYLWEPVGLPFPDLLDELIDIAMAEHAEKRQTTRTFESNLLAMRGEGAKTAG